MASGTLASRLDQKTRPPLACHSPASPELWVISGLVQLITQGLLLFLGELSVGTATVVRINNTEPDISGNGVPPVLPFLVDALGIAEGFELNPA